MLGEELDKIKKCEAAAAQMKRSAKNAAEKMTEDAAEKSRQIVREAEKKAADIYAGFEAAGERDADRLYLSHMDRVKAQCAAMEAKARDRVEEVAGMIVERIVDRYGNS